LDIDDSEKKVTGGRNGYGAKLTNIFSTEFIVETTDSSAGKKYHQIFKNNMSITENPKLTSYSKKEEYTMIAFKPDFRKFNMSQFDDDIIALLKKRVYDISKRGHRIFFWALKMFYKYLCVKTLLKLYKYLFYLFFFLEIYLLYNKHT